MPSVMPCLAFRYSTSHAVYLLLNGLHGFVHHLNLLLVSSLLPSQLLQLQGHSIRLLQAKPK